jgi:hypothetical protein
VRDAFIGEFKVVARFRAAHTSPDDCDCREHRCDRSGRVTAASLSLGARRCDRVDAAIELGEL